MKAPDNLSAPPEGAEQTESGLASMVLAMGTGREKPGQMDSVTVHYSGWTANGACFDSSVKRGKPATFPLNGVIKGWTEGLQHMVVGEKRRFWIPADLAYGEQAVGGRPGGMLVFDVELLELHAVPKAPADVTAPPEDAERTATGLASKLLSPGAGDARPTAADQVKVHYSGWTADGELFDSSVVRGEPVTFPLTQVIPGWTEGLQLMAKDEKRRFWIPAELAYGVNPPPGAPAGMLVFDVELLEINA
jgi:FKBP-type peptidyl-prolyl cis-trans isomerase